VERRGDGRREGSRAGEIGEKKETGMGILEFWQQWIKLAWLAAVECSSSTLDSASSKLPPKSKEFGAGGNSGPVVCPQM